MLKVVSIKVGKAPVVVEIDGSLKSMQNLVGGHIECSFPFEAETAMTVICDEEGLCKGKEFNCYINGTPYVGDIFICGITGEDFTSVPNEYLEQLVGR